MLLSDISIRRPVVAIVISLLLVVFGFAGGMRLPVRETPDIDIPTVFVNVSYPGASAEVVETKVVKLIEQQIGGVTGLKTIRSFARDNFAGFNMEFVVGHNLDEAANDIRDQLGRISNRLPEDANPPVIQKQDSDNEPIVNVTFYSTKRSQLDVTDYLTVNVQPRLSTIPGIAAVDFRNARQKSLRVWIDRRAMAARELTVTDIENALRRENVELGAGMLESAERNYTMRTLRSNRAPARGERAARKPPACQTNTNRKGIAATLRITITSCTGYKPLTDLTTRSCSEKTKMPAHNQPTD